MKRSRLLAIRHDRFCKTPGKTCLATYDSKVSTIRLVLICCFMHIYPTTYPRVFNETIDTIYTTYGYLTKSYICGILI